MGASHSRSVAVQDDGINPFAQQPDAADGRNPFAVYQAAEPPLEEPHAPVNVTNSFAGVATRSTAERENLSPEKVSARDARATGITSLPSYQPLPPQSIAKSASCCSMFKKGLQKTGSVLISSATAGALAIAAQEVVKAIVSNENTGAARLATFVGGVIGFGLAALTKWGVHQGFKRCCASEPVLPMYRR